MGCKATRATMRTERLKEICEGQLSVGQPQAVKAVKAVKLHPHSHARASQPMICYGGEMC